MRRDLIALAAALNKNEQFGDAGLVQNVVISIDDVIKRVEYIERWAWPPRLDRSGNMVLVDGA